MTFLNCQNAFTIRSAGYIFTHFPFQKWGAHLLYNILFQYLLPTLNYNSSLGLKQRNKYCTEPLVFCLITRFFGNMDGEYNLNFFQFGDGVLGASGEVLREKSGVRDRLSGYCIVASLFSPSVPK